MLHFREFGNLLARSQAHVGLFPVRAIPGKPAAAAEFAARGGSPDIFHFHLEQLFDRLANMRLVGVHGHFEAERSLFVLLSDTLFRDQRTADDLIVIHYASASESFFAADWLRNTCS